MQAHPCVRLALRMVNVSRARELGGIMAAVGLASNLAAMRALATEGIQKGPSSSRPLRHAVIAGSPRRLVRAKVHSRRSARSATRTDSAAASTAASGSASTALAAAPLRSRRTRSSASRKAR